MSQYLIFHKDTGNFVGVEPLEAHTSSMVQKNEQYFVYIIAPEWYDSNLAYAFVDGKIVEVDAPAGSENDKSLEVVKAAKLQQLLDYYLTHSVLPVMFQYTIESNSETYKSVGLNSKKVTDSTYSVLLMNTIEPMLFTTESGDPVKLNVIEFQSNKFQVALKTIIESLLRRRQSNATNYNFHKLNIQRLSTIQEIEEYDFTVDFNFNGLQLIFTRTKAIAGLVPNKTEIKEIMVNGKKLD
jgi:hypothetical protein